MIDIYVSLKHVVTFPRMHFIFDNLCTVELRVATDGWRQVSDVQRTGNHCSLVDIPHLSTIYIPAHSTHGGKETRIDLLGITLPSYQVLEEMIYLTVQGWMKGNEA